MRFNSLSTLGLFGSLSILALACSSNNPGPSDNGTTGGMTGATTGGAMTTGGKSNIAGTFSSGGKSNTGGMMTSGGASNTGGMMTSGGMSSTGGMMMTGGMTSTGGMMATGGTSGMGGMTTTGGMSSAAGMSSMGGMSGVTNFKLRIENTSTNSSLPTLLAPGAYAVINGTIKPFTSDMTASAGLEKAAEDANPALLATEIMGAQGVASSGIFNVPVGANSPGPLNPGDAYEFTFSAMPSQTLHFESMFGQSNDTYVAATSGIALFNGSGTPLSGDVTTAISLWDAGSERNEAPGMGPNQAPRQPAPNTGPTEAGVSLRTDGTRSIPIPSAMVDVSVSLTGSDYTVTLTNKSDTGPLMSPLSPAFYALHNSAYHYFTAGTAASAGLERLAEEGNSAVLVTEANAAGAVAATAGTAAFGPGASVMFTVTPTSAMPLLSMAMMIGQTNDVFIGTRPQGVPLLDTAGMPRAAADVQLDIVNLLAVWDAGTEANEVPGVGPNQAPRQAASNTGPADPINMVRLYADSTNDLAHLSGLVSVVVTHGTGTTFSVIVSNTSGGSTFPLNMSPVAWALHGDSLATFTLGAMASPGLEHLAEDGASTTLLSEWAANSMVSSSGVAGAAPFGGGTSVSFQATPDGTHRYLSIEAMLVPSNDTFAALGPMGVALLDTSGSPRSDSDIAADIMTNLAAYESGTEANQGSALGPDMAPYQSAPNTGANEGSGRVRPIDGVWPFPAVPQVLRVTLTPM